MVKNCGPELMDEDDEGDAELTSAVAVVACAVEDLLLIHCATQLIVNNEPAGVSQQRNYFSDDTKRAACKFLEKKFKEATE
jgi:hypothetical protein